MFNENSRVKIPALVHLTRLGYKYLSLKDREVKSQLDPETNILTDIFRKQVEEFNPEMESGEIDRLVENIRLELGDDDLGRKFYARLIDTDIKLIDYANPKDGEANKALIEIIAKHFGMAKSNIEIISGHKSKIKRVKVLQK